MIRSFHLVSDPGHSWLKVPVAELQRLGIESNISSYSYIRNGVAYLEEDVDARIFLDERAKENEPLKVKEFHRSRTSKIRKYQTYTPPANAVPAKKAGAAYLESVESEDPMDDFNYVGHPAHY
jgi:hypothetical protein